MMIDDKVRQKLEEVGITLDCESPLEISDDTSEAFASGYFAETIIDYIMNGGYDDEDD